MSNIDPEFEKIKSHVKSGEYDMALLLCDQFISRYPDAWMGYREKASILTKMKNYKEALSVQEKLVEIGSEEPCDYYDLAHNYIYFGMFRECVVSSDACISICKKHNHYYYYKPCCFTKAFGLLRLKEYKAALEACGEIDGDFSVYVSKVGMVSIIDIVNQATRGLNGESPE